MTQHPFQPPSELPAPFGRYQRGGMRSMEQAYAELPRRPAPAKERRGKRSRPKRAWGLWAGLVLVAGILGVLILAVGGVALYSGMQPATEELGSRRLELDPADAAVKIEVDGVPDHRHGDVLRLRPGVHRLTVYGKDWQAVHQPFDVSAGDNKPLSVKLVKAAALVPAAEGGGDAYVLLHDQNGYFARNIPDEPYKKIVELAKQGATLKCIAFTPSGGWVILHDKNGVYARGIPDKAYEMLGQLQKRGDALKSITFPPGGGWVILYDKNGVASENLPGEAASKLSEFAKGGSDLTSIAFKPGGGWVILLDKNDVFARDIPDEAFKKLVELKQQGAQLKSISFAPGGGWVILYDKNRFFARGIPDEAYQKLGELAKQGAALTSVSFSAKPYLQLSKDDAKTRQQILARLANYKVPGISIAVIQGGKLEWARAFGVRQGEEKTLTGKTRFQAASISKPVTALAALLLAQQNKINLDQDLNKQLVSWMVPDNEFTKQQRPTIRQVLSHSAGFSVHGFPGYAAGTPLPSVLQILDGKKPANTAAIRVVLVPGTKFQYSGGGYTVLQQLLTDVAKTPFPKLMQDQVLGPLGMKNSTYAQPLPKEWEAEAAVAHNQAGKPLAGNWHVYPEMAAAGLWTTPSDLALFVMALCRAQKGDKDAVLSPALAKAMFTRQIGDVGLGIFLSGKDRSLSFSHGGSNEGYRCHFIGFPATGQGAVLMTNSDNGMQVINEFLENLRTEYQWPG